PRLHDRKADAPQPAPHQIHAEESRDQEIDVPGPGLDDALVPDAGRVGAAPRALQRFVRLEPRQPALGPGGVVAIDDRIARYDDERDPSRAELDAGRGRIE